MTPHAQFCHNPQCPVRGQGGQGNIRVQSDADQRYRCTTCGQPFAATMGMPFYRVRPAADVVTLVLTLVCHGCPIHAMVAAFGRDERTVAAWVARAGHHCQPVQQHVVQQGHVELPHVQADERWVNLVGRRVWMAMAMAVPSRLGLGGVSSAPRDLPRITALVPLIRSCARPLPLLVCVAGVASYVTAVLRVFRHPVYPGRRGRPRLVREKGVLGGHVIKRSARRRVGGVEPRVVRGTKKALAAVVATTHTGTGINTADLARLHATCRASLAPLVRRGRAIVHTATALTAGMWRVGWAYNCCWLHQRRQLAAPAGAPWTWQARTPAMAAGLTDHRWTMHELMRYQVPLPAWVAPKRRGRPPKRLLQPAMAAAA